MEFDINRVFSAVNADKAKVGSIGYFAYTLHDLKIAVENNYDTCTLTEINSEYNRLRFMSNTSTAPWNFFYLIEEPKEEQLCTYKELSRWLSAGRGQANCDCRVTNSISYNSLKEETKDEQ